MRCHCLLPQAKYYSKQSYDLSDLEPVVAKPHSPDNKALAKDCRDTKIDRVYIGSCTGGKTEDFAAAARILQNKKANFVEKPIAVDVARTKEKCNTTSDTCI